MTASYPIVGIAGLTFVAYATWRVVSQLLVCFRPGSLFAYFLNPSEASALSLSAPVQNLANQLREMGFEYLGVKVEQRPLKVPGIREVSFAAPRHGCFASIPVLTRQPLYYYFYTPFSDDGVVLTANAFFEPRTAPGYRVSTTSARAPAQILEAHKLMVEELAQQGYQPWKDFSQESRVVATRHYYQAAATRQRLRQAGIKLVLILAVVAALLGLALATS